MRQALRQTRTLGATGRFKEGLAESRRLVEEADAIGWRPLAALARLDAARFASDTADLEQPAISDVSLIGTLSPADPYKDGRLLVQLEAMKYLLDEVKGELAAGRAEQLQTLREAIKR